MAVISALILKTAPITPIVTRYHPEAMKTVSFISETSMVLLPFMFMSSPIFLLAKTEPKKKIFLS